MSMLATASPTKLDRAGTARPLEGRVALVTGSTSGIGLGIARALAHAGADIVLNGLGAPSEIHAVRSGLAAEAGVRVGYGEADLRRPEQVAAMVGQVRDDFERVDILVNNAGIQHVAPIEAFTPERWDAVLAVNLSAAFHLTRLLLPGMRARNWGRIVNVASAHGLVGSAFKSAYVAAKHGLVGLTKVTALEVAETGITANAICPGYVWTPLVEKQIADQAKAHGIPPEEVIRTIMLAQQPNRRFVSVEELGDLAVFLCGPAAASITGTALPVDGGWTAH